MARSKPEPYKAFEDNMRDADALLDYAEALENRRGRRRMRRELRERIGDALKISGRHRTLLDCLESEDLFVVFLPGGKLGRGDFDNLSPLLRQSLVAACAALETYVADKAMEFVWQALNAEDIPSRMKNIQLTVGRWTDIERRYKRRQWGIRKIVEEHIIRESSTAPSKIGQVFSAVGVAKWPTRVDAARRVSEGTTVQQLTTITDRRNRIVHSGDRLGRGRASIRPEEVRGHLETMKSVAEATERLLAAHDS